MPTAVQKASRDKNVNETILAESEEFRERLDEIRQELIALAHAGPVCSLVQRETADW